jgi:hypothetical protein
MDNTRPLYVVETFICHGVQTDTNLIVRSKGKRFLITLTAETFKDSPAIQQQYLEYLKPLQLENLSDNVTLEDWILDPFLAIFRALTPLPVGSYTLEDYLSAETLSYTLRVAGEERIPVLYDEPPSVRDMGVPLSVENSDRDGPPLSPDSYSRFSVFLPSQVEIGSNLDDRPTKVRINTHTDCFFKQVYHGDVWRLQNELKVYRHIQEAGSLLQRDDNNVRISRLHGLVQDDSGSFIIGLVLSFIDCGFVTLLCAVKPDTTKALRERWSHQVTFTLKCLHEAGIIWGDVKAENVLIDANKNAWIIDFGGGYTEGWVEKQLAGTMEGDLQGLAKILEYLNVASFE